MFMNGPIVGLIPLWDDVKESIWMLPGYERGIMQAGGIPITLPYTNDAEALEKICRICDGFLLTGGHDVDPELYGAMVSEQCGKVCKTRDAMENYVLNYALKKDMPVLGICRGHQFINAALGGTLYQDLPTEHPSDIEHHQSVPYDKPSHKVSIIKGSPLMELLKTEILSVNSYHHQAIKQLTPKLSAMAISEDGLIESVYMPGKRFVWGVQWHPEFAYVTDAASRAILEHFVEACSENVNS